MELGNDEERFRAAVQAIGEVEDSAHFSQEEQSPHARLLGMTEETIKQADGEDGAEVVASLRQENAELRRRVRELEE